MSDNVIAVENLIKEFPHIRAVDNISFTINRGEIFGFLGPNGAGKSTLFLHFNGILRPTNGSLIVDGEKRASILLLIKVFHYS